MNALVPVQSGLPVGTQQGNWTWDGTNWVCSPCGSDGSGGQFPFCPPPGFPPAGCPPWFSGMNSPPWYPGANAGVSFGSSPPMNAVRGHFWWNGLFLSIFDGAAWVNASTGQIVPIPPNGGPTPTPPPPAGSVVISATAPGNPFAGMQWWNGTILQMWDGTKWVTIGPGQGAGPVPTTTIVFGISAPSDFPLSGTPGSYAIVAFTATPQVDSLIGWDAITHKYRPTRGGIYQFNLRSWTGTQAGFSIAKNDPGTYSNLPTSDIVVAVGSQGAPGFMSISGISVMNGTTDFVRCFGWNQDAAFHNLGANPVFSAVLLP